MKQLMYNGFIWAACLMGVLPHTGAAGEERLYELWEPEPAPNRGHDFDIVKAGGKPYDEDWERWSYPIGNGYAGVNIFGRTDTERIQISEKTLHNQGVYYRGGTTSFAELYLDINHGQISNYRRALNLNDAIASVAYDSGGMRYTREYFASYPDNVIVVRLEADQAGALTFVVRPEIPYLDQGLRTGTVTVSGNLLTLKGTIAFFNCNYEGQIKVLNEGGSVTANAANGTLNVEDADAVTLLIAAGTNYELSEHVFTASRTSKLDPNRFPHDAVAGRMAQAASLGYEELRNRHLADYRNLFGRVSVNLGASPTTEPTHLLLEQYKNGDADAWLEELMFQYGRYLLIASSREKTLPSNLQGVWTQYHLTPWTGGYWHNINVQMNYWGAMSANLSECFESYIEYFKAYLPEARVIARQYVEQHNPDRLDDLGGDNGWIIGTGANAYNVGTPGGHSGPGTGGFTSKLLMDYYLFTQDHEFLQSVAYPAMLSLSKFYAKALKPHGDLLLVEPSASPENQATPQQVVGMPGNLLESGYYVTTGCTFDQGFVWEAFNDTLILADALGQQDSFLDTIREQITKLDPIQIGTSGQIKEYREEQAYSDIGDPHHRHISHLCTLYPGTLINSQHEDWMQAAGVTLDLRGHNTTGWALAHRMTCRARLKQGEKAHQMYQHFIRERTAPNLWSLHPPFQIDGNLGTMAGVVEMLLQSHEGYIDVLPALPQTWNTGSFSGLVARGDFEISASWQDGKVSEITVLSRRGGECRLHTTGIAFNTVRNEQGTVVPTADADAQGIRFDTHPGELYRVALGIDSQDVRTVKDQPKSINLTGSYADGDALAYSIVGGPSNGVLDVTPLPEVIYTPNPGYVGTDRFTFQGHDGMVDLTPGTISITIVASNAPPVVNAGADRTVAISTNLPWTPADLSPTAWYDAADTNTITASGGAVSQWSDKSGKGLHLAAAVGNPQTGAAINGLNALDFTGDAMTTASNPFGFAINNAFVITVHKVDTVSNGTLFSLSGSESAANRWQSHAPYGNGIMYFDCGSVASPNRVSTSYNVSAGDVVLASFYGSTIDNVQQVYKNGSLLVSDSSGHAVSTAGNLIVGGFASGYQDTTIGESIIIKGRVDAATRHKLEGYLAHKWGLEGSLYTDHPYKSAAPGETGTSVVLDGSSVTDPDGDTLSQSWTLVSAPAGGTAVFDDPKLLHPTVTFDTVGLYTLRITVDDGIATDFDEILISVTGDVTADAGPDQTVIDSDDNGSEDVTLDGSSSIGAGSDTITHYVWNDGTSDIATGIAPTVTLAVGTHTIILTVTDDGGTTDTDSVSITVSSPNNPPAVNAGTDQTVAISTNLPWTPADLSPAAWYDAADTTTITASSGAVSQWSDKSGNGKHATQGTSTAQPTTGAAINGNNALNFSLDFFSTGLEQLTHVSMYLVLNPTVIGGDNLNGPIGATIEEWRQPGFGWGLEAWGSSEPTNSVTYEPGDPKKLLSVYCNGVKGANHSFQPALFSHHGTGLTTENLDYRIGSCRVTDWSGGMYKGLMGEIIIDSQEHNETTRQRVEGYLAHKWGLENSLPAGHPYKSAAPEVSAAVVSLSDASVTDADGNTLSHSWTVVSAPAGATVVFDDESLVNATVTFDTVGAYVLRLTADDGSETVFDVLRITVTDASSTLANWIGAYELGGLTGIDDDYDGDGLANGIENYFGTDPSQANPGLNDTVVQTIDGATTFTFEHPLNDNPAFDISARYRWSKDLSAFHEDGATDSQGTTVHFSQSAPVDGRVTVTASIEGTDSDRIFVQLVVTQN